MYASVIVYVKVYNQNPSGSKVAQRDVSVVQ